MQSHANSDDWGDVEVGMPLEHQTLSIALPVYNGANFLREALDSILAQDFARFEVVVSDNASTDETPRILEEFARKDARIRVFRTEEFLPQQDNVNRAVDLCSGEWVKLFCHDDLMKADCLKIINDTICSSCPETVGLISNGEAWLFANGYVHQQRLDGPPTVEQYHGRELVLQMLNGRNKRGLPALTTATVRKTAWNASRKFSRDFIHFDVFLWIELLLHWDYVCVNQPITINRIHSAQVMASVRKTCRSIHESRQFYRWFIQNYHAELNAGWLMRAKAWARWVATAGTLIATKILRKDFAGACAIVSEVPPHCFVMLPFFIARTVFRERHKLKSLRGHVPVSLIYPE